MLRIYMFAMCAPPFVCGGGRQALALARKLATQNVSVTFLTINIDGQAPPLEQHPNLTIKRVYFSSHKYWQTMWFGFWSAWFLWRNRQKIDLIHYPTGAFLYISPSLLLARLLGKPTVLKLTAVGVDDPAAIQQRRFGRLFILILQHIDRIVLTTAEFEQKHAQSPLNPQRAVMIPNGVDTDHFKPPTHKSILLHQNLQIPQNSYLVLMVGRVNLGKGVDLLLEAWPQVRKQHPQAHLLIIGEPTDDHLPNGQTVSSTLRQSPNIHILPYQQDILPYYQSADLFVLPSRSEGLPNATLEAMSVGLPVVISDIGGHRAITHEQAGVCFFASGSASQLRDRLLTQLAQLSKEAFKSQTRSIILKKFSLTKVAQQYIHLYQQLLEN